MFRRFVYERLASGLLAAGAQDLRAYTFLPYTALAAGSPGVAHDNPIEHRYHGLIVFGINSRAALNKFLKTPPVADVIAAQDTVLTAVHAYSVERTVPVIRARSLSATAHVKPSRGAWP
jgi:hypothetical protein